MAVQVTDTEEDFIVYKLPRALQPAPPDEPGAEATVSVGRHTLTKVGWGAGAGGGVGGREWKL